MKKLPLAFVLSAAILLSACSVFDKLSEVDYNNKVVDTINTTSETIEETATLYNDTVPDVVSEKDEVDTSAMQKKYDAATNALEDMSDLLNLEARNIEQQNAIRTDLGTYQSAAEQYLETYSAMLSYYGEGTYKEDLSKVQSMDEDLHTAYTTFIQANNDLVDALDSYVNTDSTEEPANP